MLNPKQESRDARSMSCPATFDAKSFQKEQSRLEFLGLYGKVYTYCRAATALWKTISNLIRAASMRFSSDGRRSSTLFLLLLKKTL